MYAVFCTCGSGCGCVCACGRHGRWYGGRWYGVLYLLYSPQLRRTDNTQRHTVTKPTRQPTIAILLVPPPFGRGELTARLVRWHSLRSRRRWPGGRVGECDGRGAKCGVVRRTLPGCGLRRAEIGRRRRRKKEGVGGGGVSVSVGVCVRWGGRLADWIGLAK